MGASMPNPGLTAARLHHVGYLVADIMAATSHFREAFGYVVESDVIRDQLQTASVQFLRLPGDSSWLELITPLGNPSKLDGALRRGEGLHHVCYEVPEIESSMSALRGHGLLPIAKIVPGAAFGGRRITWMMSRGGLLLELLEAGIGPLSLTRTK